MKRITNLLRKTHSASFIGLNVGCGEGHMLSYLHNERAIGHMVAVDLNEERLDHSRSRCPACRYLKCDVNELSLRSNTFDYILATEILEHLPDPGNAMKEIRRVAKNEAYFIVSVPHEPFFHWGNLLRGKYWRRRGRTPAHLSFWNRSEFRKFIRGLIEIEEEYYVSTFPWLLYLGRFRPKE